MHRIRRTAVAACALAGLAGAALLPGASAGGAASSSISLDAVGFQDPDFLVPMGVVSSPVKKCVANRTVKVLFADFEGPYTQVDTAHTNEKGGWAGIGHSESVGRVKAKVVESRYGRKGHRKTLRGGDQRRPDDQLTARTLKALRPALILALALAGAAGIAGQAIARAPTHATAITVDGFYGIVPNVEVYGSITSEEKRCIPGRRVKVYIQPTKDDPFTQIDTALTSQNGAWMGFGEGDFPNAAMAKVTRSTFGSQASPPGLRERYGVRSPWASSRRLKGLVQET